MIRTSRRRGFTLVEMLVAMALAIVILGLAIGISQTGAFDSYKTVGAADRLSQWMLVAKNKALRDRAPRGIRLISDTTNPDFIKEIAYIEQPDPIPSNGPLLLGSRLTFYYPCRVTQTTMPANTTYDFDTLTPIAMGAPAAPAQRGVYLSFTTAQLTEFAATVQPNDLISIPELRSVLRLGNPTHLVNPAVPPGPNTAPNATILLNVQIQSLPDLGRSVFSYHNSSTNNGAAHPSVPQSAQPNPTHGTLSVTSFSIIRAPRPVLGEPTQQFPTGMAVDVRTSVPNPAPPPATIPVLTSLNPPSADPTTLNRDILFSPTGEVIGAPEAITCLLMRDVNLPNCVHPLTTDYERAGQMILICVYNKTGAISTQPVNPPAVPPTDPYRFARDGINTGL